MGEERRFSDEKGISGDFIGSSATQLLISIS